jgi:hypothetical protein
VGLKSLLNPPIIADMREPLPLCRLLYLSARAASAVRLSKGFARCLACFPVEAGRGRSAPLTTD